MQNFELILSSPVAKSFRATKAANSLDIDSEKKSIHTFKIEADIKSKFNIGLIVGASGSGKTTLAKHIWGEECFKEILDLKQPVIDQFPDSYNYDDCAAMLCGVGLTSVPCWIRPAYTLSNGQRTRAECALQMAKQNDEMIIIDEWTSVVDRTVAKVMSHCIQKHARKHNKNIILLSCHYDVIEWLNPDWVIDANKQEYLDRRLLWRDFKRTEQLEFDIKEINKNTWKYFSKYHYLSDNLPGGLIKTFGLFQSHNQIGFVCYANYVPHRANTVMQMHMNRIVIHPDYCGFGLGIKFINKTSEFIQSLGYDVRSKFSSTPVYLAMKQESRWRLMSVDRKTHTTTGKLMQRKKGFRQDIKTYSFRFV